MSKISNYKWSTFVSLLISLLSSQLYLLRTKTFFLSPVFFLIPLQLLFPPISILFLRYTLLLRTSSSYFPLIIHLNLSINQFFSNSYPPYFSPLPPTSFRSPPLYPILIYGSICPFFYFLLSLLLIVLLSILISPCFPPLYYIILFNSYFLLFAPILTISISPYGSHPSLIISIHTTILPLSLPRIISSSISHFSISLLTLFPYTYSFHPISPLHASHPPFRPFVNRFLYHHHPNYAFITSCVIVKIELK